MNSNKHTISDEMLSAYLDNELSGAELTAVEQALAAQPAVANRLATLKLVNELAKGQSHVMDAQPMPAAVLQLLGSEEAKPEKAPVLSLLLHRAQTLAPRSLALAASLVLTVGLSLVLLTQYQEQQNNQSALTAYSEILDTVASGTKVTTDNLELTPRFTFVSRANTVCRLYQIDTATSSSNNIACRDGDNWILQTTIATATLNLEQYLPASNLEGQIDTVLDELMLDKPLTSDQEKALINRNWQAF